MHLFIYLALQHPFHLTGCMLAAGQGSGLTNRTQISASPLPQGSSLELILASAALQWWVSVWDVTTCICWGVEREGFNSAHARWGQLTILPMLPASPSIPARPLCPLGGSNQLVGYHRSSRSFYIPAKGNMKKQIMSEVVRVLQCLA